MPEQIKRHIAFKVSIKDLLEGKHVKEEGEWAPNYIQINDKRVSRVNLLGVVVSKPVESNPNYKSMVLDDGSGKISIRSFDGSRKIDYSEIGEVISVIGRPREFGNEIYIVPEIIKKIDDRGWIEVRKTELKKDNKSVIETKEETIKNKTETIINDPAAKIFELIKEADSGDGADMQEIIGKVDINDSEKIIKNLLETGEIFEIKPGRLKVLE